jgi:site-specific DNA-methyltransferase (adenine-specific)
MSDSIVWTEETRKLSELKPYEHNPRRISKIAYERLVDKIKRLGYHNRIRINIDNTIVAGHQRLRALKECGFKEIPVLVPDRLLNPNEFGEDLIGDNLDYGENDMDMLANHFEISDLVRWGMPIETFAMPNLDENTTELSKEDFDNFKHQCPKCGFEYD